MAVLKRLTLLFLFPITLFAQPDTSRFSIALDALNAADIDQNLVKNATTITSVSRTAQDLNQIPFTGYIITAQEIAQRGYKTLVDVLKDLPGVKVSQPGSAQHGETFLMRGLFGNYYVKILVDDLPIQPSATSGMPIGAQLPVAQAERIEVIYGPAASIYGADAMAGVINIVTKKADNLYFADAEIYGGIPGNVGFEATIGGKFATKKNVLSYMVYGGFTQFNNLPITGGEYDAVYNPEQYAILSGDTGYLNSPYFKGTANLPRFTSLPNESGKFGLRIGSKKLTFGFDYGYRQTHSAIGSNPLIRTYHDPNTRFGENILRAFASYKTLWGKWQSQTNAQVLHYYVDPNSSYITQQSTLGFQGQFYSYAESLDLYAEQFLSRDFGPHFNLLAGATMQYSGNLPQTDLYSAPFDRSAYKPFATSLTPEYAIYESLGFSPFNFYNIGAVLEAAYQAKNTRIIAGGRFDYREYFGSAISPRIGITQLVGKRHHLRSTFSTAFRPPSSFLIYNGAVGITVDSVSIAFPIPNNSLKAETHWNVDFGWLFSISEKQSLDLSAFYHKTNQLISRTNTSVTTPDGQLDFFGFLSDENASAQLFGLQVVHNTKFNLGRLGLRSALSLTYAQGSEELPFNYGTLSYYRMQPAYTAKWLLEATPFKSVYISIRSQFFSTWRTRSVVRVALADELVADSFYTIDLNLRYEVAAGKEIYLMVNNVTNNYHFGIGASGGAGLLNNRIVFEDLFFNPQLLRVIKVGVRIAL
jgi:outer membrane receptor protein involved in Fe transport